MTLFNPRNPVLGPLYAHQMLFKDKNWWNVSYIDISLNKRKVLKYVVFSVCEVFKLEIGINTPKLRFDQHLSVHNFWLHHQWCVSQDVRKTTKTMHQL